jgi:hypothetical protein
MAARARTPDNAHSAAAQQALPPDAAPLRFTAQVKRVPLGGNRLAWIEYSCHNMVGPADAITLIIILTR